MSLPDASSAHAQQRSLSRPGYPGVAALKNVVDRIIGDALDTRAGSDPYARQLSAAFARSLSSDAAQSSLGMLPLLTCEASGGARSRGTVVAAAWRLLRLAAKLFDDVEDNEAAMPAAQAINLATGLLFVAHSVLACLRDEAVPLQTVQDVCQELDRAGLLACAAQNADLTSDRETMSRWDADTWLTIAVAKSGGPVAWAAWAGAAVAGAAEDTLAAFHQYGHHLGVLLQIADDFNSAWRVEGESDLATGRMNLPVCYALSVGNAGERARLLDLLAGATRGDARAETQARQLLIDLGAQHFLLTTGRVHCQQALAALDRVFPPPTSSLAKKRLTTVLYNVLPALRESAKR